VSAKISHKINIFLKNVPYSRKEEEIGLDNYKTEVEVPSEQAEKFVQEDAAYVKSLLD